MIFLLIFSMKSFSHTQPSVKCTSESFFEHRYFPCICPLVIPLDDIDGRVRGRGEGRIAAYDSSIKNISSFNTDFPLRLNISHLKGCVFM